MVQFAEFTQEEEQAVGKIIERMQLRSPQVSQLDIRMDLAAVHSSNPLRLADLAEAEDFNFWHDICGIGENLNRETGELGNCFSPRYSA